MSQIIIDEQEEFIIFHLIGQFIGGDETDSLRESLKSVLDNENKKVILNLEKTTYLNSTALGVLISSNANFSKKNGKIVLANLNKSIENIFIITKLNLIFTIFSNLEEAKISISN